MISPFLKTGSSLEKKYHDFREGLKTLDQLELENKQLIISTKELSAINQTLRGLEAENNQLRKALQYRERAIFSLKPARIISRDSSTWHNKIIIDRGAKDGLDVGGDQPVLTESGKVAATVEGTSAQGIVKGERISNGTIPEVGLNFISKQSRLQPGQSVFTSGTGGVFPSGVLIGRVKEFKVRELDGHASITPAVDLATLEDVFVVIGKNR